MMMIIIYQGDAGMKPSPLGNLIVRRRPAFHELHTKEHSDESAQ